MQRMNSTTSGNSVSMTLRRLPLTSRVLKPTRPLKDRRFRQSPMTVRALKHPMLKAVPPNQALARRPELAGAKPTVEPGDRRDLDESRKRKKEERLRNR